VAPVFAAVAKERGLAVRASNARAHEQLRQEKVRVPDRFIESFYGSGATLVNLKFIIEHLREGVSELMCHPGHPDTLLVNDSSYAQEREQETAVLCDPSLRATLAAAGVELITFREIE
jgi:predicted glycoside hydrolase/deacetylase ChbG (UPF0249 family)